MIRAIFFDFYSVWAPDNIRTILEDAKAAESPDYEVLREMRESYYLGEMTLTMLVYEMQTRLERDDFDKSAFVLDDTVFQSDMVELTRSLHGHFVKLAVLGNLGFMEFTVLQQFNDREALFEAILSPLLMHLRQPLLTEEVFAGAFKIIEEEAASCVAISGNDDYLAFAQSLGMKPLKFVDVQQLGTELDNMLASDMPATAKKTRWFA